MRTFHFLSLLLNLTNLGLTLLVLAQSAAGMFPSGITVVFKLLKLTLLIFHPGIVQNLSFVTLKTHFSVKKKGNNLSGSSFSCSFWHFAKNVNSNFASSSFPPLGSSDGTTAVLPSS